MTRKDLLDIEAFKQWLEAHADEEVSNGEPDDDPIARWSGEIVIWYEERVWPAWARIFALYFDDECLGQPMTGQKCLEHLAYLEANRDKWHVRGVA